MISGNAWCYSDDFCTYDGKPPIAVCDSEYYGTSALDRVYKTAEGWVCLAVRTQHEFEALVGALDLPELATDVRFAGADGESRQRRCARRRARLAVQGQAGRRVGVGAAAPSTLAASRRT